MQTNILPKVSQRFALFDLTEDRTACGLMSENALRAESCLCLGYKLKPFDINKKAPPNQWSRLKREEGRHG